MASMVLPDGLRDSRRPEVTRKIIIVGGKAVGKTSFIRRFVDKPIAGLKYVPTIGIDVIVYPMMYAETPVYLHFWDISYSELEASVSHHALIFNNVAGIFLVLDVSSRESLEALDAWQRLLAKYVPGRVPRVLLAHKADLFSEAQCVVNDRLLETYKREAGLTDWCWTVGHEHFGDYVANRSSKSKPVSDAVQLLVAHIFKEVSLPGVLGPSPGPSSMEGGPLFSKGRGPDVGFTSSSSHHQGGAAEASPSAMHAIRYCYHHHQSQGRGRPAALSSKLKGEASGKENAEEAAASTEEKDEEENEISVKTIQSYQPLQGWLSSEDLEVIFRRAGTRGVSRLLPTVDDELYKQERRRALKAGGEDEEEGGGGISIKEVWWRDAKQSEDPGWRHLAGSIGRAEAEQILRPRPVGAFLLRRVDERSLRLSYKTQHSVEHAPLVFNGWAWSVVRALQGPPRGGSSEHQKQPTPCFGTLAELLRFFSKKAIVGLCFRRIPGSSEYELIEEGGGDAGVSFFGKRLMGWHGYGKKQQEERGSSPAALAEKAVVIPTAPGPKEILEVFRQLESVLVLIRRVQSSKGGRHYSKSGHEGEDDGDAIGRSATIVGGGGGRRRKGQMESKLRNRVLLQLCRRSCNQVIKACNKASSSSSSSPRGTLPFLMTADNEEEGEEEEGQQEEDAKPLTPEAVVAKIEAVEAQILQLLSNAIAANALANSRQRGGGERIDHCIIDLKVLHSGLASWQPILETLRLKMETKYLK